MIPKINHVPKYDVVIPSTGKEVRFRPYLVKEEKVLLTAFQSQDRKSGLKAIVDTIAACIDDEIDIRKLTMYDVEYLFTKIRSKSAGEKANITVKCSKCKTANPVEVDIDNVTMEAKEQQKRIQLTDEISVDIGYPSYVALLSNDRLMNATERHNKVINTIAESLITIYTDEEKINVKEESQEELISFVESLDDKQFTELRKFIENGPRMVYNIDFKCVSCGHDNHNEVKEAEDFF